MSLEKCSRCGEYSFYPATHSCGTEYTLTEIDDDFIPKGETVEEQWNEIKEFYGENTIYGVDIENAAEKFAANNYYSDGYGYEEETTCIAFLIESEDGDLSIKRFAVKMEMEPVYTAEEIKPEERAMEQKQPK